jgi:hypothetical protein
MISSQIWLIPLVDNRQSTSLTNLKKKKKKTLGRKEARKLFNALESISSQRRTRTPKALHVSQNL